MWSYLLLHRGWDESETSGEAAVCHRSQTCVGTAFKKKINEVCLPVFYGYLWYLIPMNTEGLQGGCWHCKWPRVLWRQRDSFLFCCLAGEYSGPEVHGPSANHNARAQSIRPIRDQPCWIAGTYLYHQMLKLLCFVICCCVLLFYVMNDYLLCIVICHRDFVTHALQLK